MGWSHASYGSNPNRQLMRHNNRLRTLASTLVGGTRRILNSRSHTANLVLQVLQVAGEAVHIEDAAHHLLRLEPGGVLLTSFVQRFLSQPFHVAEVFTGAPGKYVPLKETIRGFKMIIDGECGRR